MMMMMMMMMTHLLDMINIMIMKKVAQKVVKIENIAKTKVADAAKVKDAIINNADETPVANN